jgi:hypothetical protein
MIWGILRYIREDLRKSVGRLVADDGVLAMDFVRVPGEWNRRCHHSLSIGRWSVFVIPVAALTIYAWSTVLTDSSLNRLYGWSIVAFDTSFSALLIWGITLAVVEQLRGHRWDRKFP